MKETEIRKKVKALKALYTDILNYILVNTFLIFIWFVFDRSETFWPKYILLIWGIVLVFKAYRKDVLPFFLSHVSFLTPEWEEKKINAMLGRRHHQRKIQLKRHTKK